MWIDEQTNREIDMALLGREEEWEWEWILFALVRARYGFCRLFLFSVLSLQLLQSAYGSHAHAGFLAFAAAWLGYRGYACDVYPYPCTLCAVCVRLCHIPVIESPGIASQHCAHYEIMHVDLWCSRSLTRKLLCGTFRLNFLLNWKWLEMVWRAYVMMKLYKF